MCKKVDRVGGGVWRRWTIDEEDCGGEGLCRRCLLPHKDVYIPLDLVLPNAVGVKLHRTDFKFMGPNGVPEKRAKIIS